MNKKMLAEKKLIIPNILRRMDEAKQYKVLARSLMLDEDNETQKNLYKENYQYWLKEYHYWTDILSSITYKGKRK